MCKYCVEYGNGTKWYLNPENYNPEILNNPGHIVGYSNLTGTSRNSYEWGEGEMQQPVELFNEPYLNYAVDTMLQQAGQVISLEEAMQVIDVAPGDRFLLQHCGCRRYFGFGDFYGCMFFDTFIERTKEERPWETDSKIISKDEARQLCRDYYAKGLVISIFDCGTDTDGKTPLNLCFCNAFDCQAYKARQYRGATAEFNKGESVAVVDPKKCAKGCKNEAPCIMKCQYGAIQYSPLKDIVTVNQFQCFGCGLCRTACKYGALKLVDRMTFPALVDVW